MWSIFRKKIEETVVKEEPPKDTWDTLRGKRWRFRIPGGNTDRVSDFSVQNALLQESLENQEKIVKLLETLNKNFNRVFGHPPSE